VANDHFISRFLTAPWEEKPSRKLHFYDFRKSAFGRQSSESLFAQDGLHTKETGDLLNKFIESPVSHHRAESVRRGQVVDPGKWELYRALVGLILLQVPRFPDQAELGGETIDDILRDPAGALNGLATIAREKFTLISVTLPGNAFPLFFPDTVYFPIPMVVSRPILAVPLTPRMFIALPEKSYAEASLSEWVTKTPSTLSAFSAGLGSSAKKVLVPPDLHEQVKTDPENLATMIRTNRDLAGQIFDQFGKANAALGFPSFSVTEPEEPTPIPS
jgi:hypothetical protein